MKGVKEGQHPLILLPGISYVELRALLDYMYYGEVRPFMRYDYLTSPQVSINRTELPSLIRSSRALQVKSLGEMSEQLSRNLGVERGKVDPVVEKEEEILYLDRDNHIIAAMEEEPRASPVPDMPRDSEMGRGGGPQYRKKQSKVWAYFEKSQSGEQVVCKKCGEVQRFMSNTTNMIRHIKKAHSGQGGAEGKTHPSGPQLRRRAVPRSHVWAHFTKTGEAKVQCGLCKELYSYSGNTSNLRFHLKTRHPELANKEAEANIGPEDNQGPQGVHEVVEEVVGVEVGEVVEEVVGMSEIVDEGGGEGQEMVGETISVEVCGLTGEDCLGASVYVASTPTSYIG